VKNITNIKNRNKAGYITIFLGLSIYFFLIRSYPFISTLGIEAGNLLVLLFGPIFSLITLFDHQNKGLVFKFRRQFLLLSLSFIYISMLFYINGHFKLSCGEGTGFFPFIMTSFPPLLLNLVLGILLSTLFEKMLFRIFFWALFYVGYYLLLGYLWFKDGSFRLLNHLSIINTSDLLNGLSFSEGFISFRIATILFTFGFLYFCLTIFSDHFLSFRQKTTKKLLLLLSLALIFLAAVSEQYAKKHLGKDRTSLINQYKLIVTFDEISIKTNPQKVALAEAQAMLQEALLWKYRLKNKIGELSSKPITIWLHKSDEDKFLYTGAKNVHFALPGLREIHISGLNIPHPVLGHELAHIYVSEHSNTIFGIPGPGYFIPNVALSEGLAMALTEELNVENGLSQDEQAMALFQAGLTPDLESLFKENLGFFEADMRAAYIIAGSLINFYLAKQASNDRQKALTALIQKGSLVKILGENNFKKLLDNFKDFLHRPIPPYALFWAKQNFESHGILTKSCLKSQKTTEEKFDEAFLNKDVEMALLSLKDYSLFEKSDFLFWYLQQPIKNNEVPFLLALMNATDRIYKETDDFRLSELLIKKAQFFSLMNNFEMSLTTLDQINEHLLSPSMLRSVLIMKSFLLEILNYSLDSKLYQEALEILAKASLNNQLFEKNKFFLEMGIFSTKKQTANKAGLFAKYLEARIFMSSKDYQKALSIIEEIIPYNKELSLPIAAELFLMRAQTLKNLGRFSEAIPAFLEASKINISKGVAILIFDEIGRMNFLASHMH